MKTIKKAQAGKKVVKKKTTPHPNDDYKNMKDPKTGKKGTMGGEGTRPPFTPGERKKLPKVGNMGSAKKGATVKKKMKAGGKMTKCKYGCK